MEKNYDIIIVGMGPSSIFCVYELLKRGYNKKILMIEKGKPIEKRICPIKSTGKCEKCKPICNIIGGFSGAGAFSDGKLLSYYLSSYNQHIDDLYIGGKDDTFIKKYYSASEIKKYMQYTDNIYLEFGADHKLEGVERKNEIKELQKKASRANIKLIDVPVRHLGTEKSQEIYKKLEDYIKGKVDMLFETEVEDLIIEKNVVKGIRANDTYYTSDKVILAVGVDGASWLEKLCDKYNIIYRNGYMDIGIRYELSNKTMSDINKLLYEGKFMSNVPPYYDKVRTYCQNPSGFVTSETYDNGYTLVNGHSYKTKKSNNTNLAILVSEKFDSPFDSPIKYGFNIAEKANLLSGGKPIVQRFGDLITHQITTEEKMKINKVTPSMTCGYYGDLSYVLDYRTLTNIINFIKQMNEIIPDFSDGDNILYGPEIKFYGKELIVNKNFETSVKNLYSIGTGGGLTIGLMMASMSGVMMASTLLRERN